MIAESQLKPARGSRGRLASSGPSMQLAILSQADQFHGCSLTDWTSVSIADSRISEPAGEVEGSRALVGDGARGGRARSRSAFLLVELVSAVLTSSDELNEQVE